MRGLSVFVNVGAKLLPSLGQTARAAEQRFEKTARRLAVIGAESRAMWRGMRNDVSTFGSHVSMPAAALAGLGARAAFEWSKVGNELQAVTQMSDTARKKIEAVARAMPGNPSSNLSMALDLARTGFNDQAIIGSLKTALKLSRADNSVDPSEAADILTNVMTGMRLFDDKMGAEEIARNADRVANNIAFAGAKSSSDTRLMGLSFKYAAPLAARLGMEIEDLSAWFMIMADAGIKGSESGVALRSGFVRLLKPTKGAMAVLARLKMNLDDYVSSANRPTGTKIVDSLKAQGIAADGARAKIDALLNNKNLSGASLIQKISEAVAEGMHGGADAADLDSISDGVAGAIMAGASKVDFAKFLEDFAKKGGQVGDLVNFFDVRQGARLATLTDGTFERKRQQVESAIKVARGEGTFLDKMFAMQMKGAVGPWEKMKQGFGNAVIAMAESGVMDTAANAMQRLADGIMALSKTSPALLKFITYSIMGAAVMAPLGFALAGLAVTFRLLASPLRLIAPAWRLLFSSVGATGPRIPLIMRLGRAFSALGRFALPLRVGLMMLAKLGFRALAVAIAPALIAAAPFVAAIVAIGAAIAFVIAKWNGIKAFFSGFADGFRKAVPLEARAQLARFGSGILSLLSAINPVLFVFKLFGGVLGTVFGWLGKLFGPAEAGKWRSWGETAGAAVGGVVGWLAKLIGRLEGAIRKFRELTTLKLAPDSGIGQVLRGAARGFLSGGVAGAAVGAASASGQSVAGTRATGGSVDSGKPYLIGERGPEIMVPGRSGTVVPAHVLNALRRIGATPKVANDNGGRPGRAAAVFLAALAAPAAAAPMPQPATINVAPTSILPPPVEGEAGEAPAPSAPIAPEVAVAAPSVSVEVPGAPFGREGSAGLRDVNIKIEVDVKGAREPEATGAAVERAAERAVERVLRKLANRQAALLSD